jgi:hypothetical protein
MKPPTIISLAAVVAVSSAPAAFGWGFHGGGFSGGSYHGAYGGSFSHSDGSWSATGARGSTASGGGGSWSASGFRGGSASGGGGSWSATGYRGGTASGGGGSWSAHGAYGGSAYGYHGGYYGGPYGGYHGAYYGGAVVTRAMWDMAPPRPARQSALPPPLQPTQQRARIIIRRPITSHLPGSGALIISGAWRAARLARLAGIVTGMGFERVAGRDMMTAWSLSLTADIGFRLG